MLYGKQEPTKRIVPKHSDTYGDKADSLLKLAGIDLMPWQRTLICDWLTVNADGSWSAPSCGLSVPRQNGKTHLIAARIAFGMVAFSEWCVYTSHLQKTSTETFETLRTIFEAPALAKYVKDIKAALGREEIILTNGARCKFLARTRNGGRGQHGDLLCFDEAAEVSSEMQASFLPLLAASKRPQTLYCGTPPDENAPGEVFARIRDNALKGDTSRTAWAEWSADSIGDISDESRWAECNPSYGYRIQPQTIVGEFEQMKGADDRFARERLGWWSEQTVKAVIGKKEWEACATADRPTDGLYSYAVKFDPSGTVGTVSACVKPSEGVPHIGVAHTFEMRRGMTPIVEYLVERKDKAAQLTIDGMSNSQPLVDELLRHGVSSKAIVKPRPSDVAAACSALLNAINERGVTHPDKKELNESALKSKKRPIGSGGGWGFGDNDCDSTLIESCALAYWGALNTKRNPNRKQRIV